MTRAVLSIGSNIEDRLGNLQLAVDQLAEHVVGISPVYSTPPWGPVSQPHFLNAVLIVDDPRATARDWLHRSQACEQLASRTRTTRWGPRTLDVDVVSVDELIDDDPILTLPHPRAAERAFVLVPWCAVDSDAVLAGRGRVTELIGALPVADVMAVVLVPDVSLRR